MSSEKFMQSVLAAPPLVRRKIESILDGTATPATSDKQDLRLVTISNTARLLNVGRNVIYRLLESDRLDAVELNGCRRITMRSVTAFLNGERPANAKSAEIIAASKARYAGNKNKGE